MEINRDINSFMNGSYQDPITKKLKFKVRPDAPEFMRSVACELEFCPFTLNRQDCAVHLATYILGRVGLLSGRVTITCVNDESRGKIVSARD